MLNSLYAFRNGKLSVQQNCNSKLLAYLGTCTIPILQQELPGVEHAVVNHDEPEMSYDAQSKIDLCIHSLGTGE